MAIILAALSMGVVTPPMPLKPTSWATPYDYPARALENRQGGYPGIRLTISMEGKPTRCEVTHPTGYKGLDELSCNLLIRRARFKPARDGAGNTSIAVYRTTLTWWVAGMRQLSPRPPFSDLSIVVKTMPDGIPTPALVRIAFVVDAFGAMSDCTPVLPDPPAPARSKQAAIEQRVMSVLGPVACANSLVSYKPQPATSDQGIAVPSIQTAKIIIVQGSDKS